MCNASAGFDTVVAAGFPSRDVFSEAWLSSPKSIIESLSSEAAGLLSSGNKEDSLETLLYFLD